MSITLSEYHISQELHPMTTSHTHNHATHTHRQTDLVGEYDVHQLGNLTFSGVEYRPTRRDLGRLPTPKLLVLWAIVRAMLLRTCDVHTFAHSWSSPYSHYLFFLALPSALSSTHTISLTHYFTHMHTHATTTATAGVCESDTPP